MVSLSKVRLLALLDISGLYYKPLMIVNDDSRVVNKLETSLTDNTIVVIYDRHVFKVRATGWVELSAISKHARLFA
jgi:hypothetical protein